MHAGSIAFWGHLAACEERVPAAGDSNVFVTHEKLSSHFRRCCAALADLQVNRSFPEQHRISIQSGHEAKADARCGLGNGLNYNSREHYAHSRQVPGISWRMSPAEGPREPDLSAGEHGLAVPWRAVLVQVCARPARATDRQSFLAAEKAYDSLPRSSDRGDAPLPLHCLPSAVRRVLGGD